MNNLTADLRAIGRDGQYISNIKQRVLWLVDECGWQYPGDVSSTDFQTWRVKQAIAPQTLNQYLKSASTLPSMHIFKADLAKAKIDFIDSNGLRADFHSLRYTLATNLARAGIAPRVAMELMRHGNMQMTMKTYTDAGLLPNDRSNLGASFLLETGRLTNRLTKSSPGEAKPVIVRRQ